MSGPNPLAPSHTILLVFFVFLLESRAQPAPARNILFSTLTPPVASESYDPTKLSPGASIVTGPKRVPIAFRSFVKRSKGFTYDIVVAPGRYSVKLGFYEFFKCKSGARVFKISANGKESIDIDTFAAKGCETAYFVNIFNVKAFAGLIQLKATPVKGGPAFLANVKIIKRSDRPVTIAPTVTVPSTTSNRLASIVFTKGPVPRGWTRYVAPRLDSGVEFVNSGVNTLKRPFRNYAKKNGGFNYNQPLQPGVYRVVLGFAETAASRCAVGERVFKVRLNTKDSKDIDVFTEVGCSKPFTLAMRVTLQPGITQLQILLLPVKGFAPMLSNFRIYKTLGGGTSAPTTATSVITPTTATRVTTVTASTAATSVTTVTAPTEGELRIVSNIDAGGGSDMASLVTGTTKVYPNVVPIAGTDDNARFSRHRFGLDFSYVVKVKPNIQYGVTLDFAESFAQGCVENFRTFDVAVFDTGGGIATGNMIKSLDVFKEAGCQTALEKTLKGINVGESGSITIKLMAVNNNAMMAAFTIFTTDPKFMTGPTPTPLVGPLKTFALVNVGGETDGVPPGTKVSVTNLPVIRTKSATAAQLQSSRFGTDFTYSFNLKPGAYDVILVFSENFEAFCSTPGKRVFNVYINGMIQLEGYDIFAKAGCRKGIELLMQGHTVGAVDLKPLTIRFSSVVNFAQVNFIKIKKAAKPCVPASMTGSISTDHAVHSVPGSYPPQNMADAPKSYVDLNNKGFVRVNINGAKSHTHFFDAPNNIIGKITSYTWSIVETGQVISRKEKFSYKFPLGTTRLKLAVTDNACTSDEAETTVTVTGKIQTGAYCYYYAGLGDVPLAGADAATQPPDFAKVSVSLKLGFPDFPFESTNFGARCVFFLQVDEISAASEISLLTFGTGVAKVYKGDDLIIDTTASPLATTSLSVGLIGFEIVYLRTTLSKPPMIHFFVNDKVPENAMVTHDRTTIRPILNTVSPKEGPTTGGTKVKISGNGLFPPLNVKIDGKKVNVLTSDQTPNQFFIITPPADAGTVEIIATSAAGIKSNPILFNYGSSCDSVNFEEFELTKPDGSDVDLKLPTCASIGQDGKIYMGTIGGSVQVLGYNPKTLATTSQCYSKAIKDSRFMKDAKPAQRTILGLTFDPRDKLLRPYVSTSTLDWWFKDKIDISNTQAWMNGAVDRLTPGTDPTDSNVCLIYDKRIVSNLPVSNHDHAPNAIVFTQEGDLLMVIGGFTNLGLPGYKLGGFWETELSAAVLIAKLSKPGFNGEIGYSNPDTPRLAKKISGDVDLYATGLRNAFAMAITTAGEIYACDNGPNCTFGDTATTCADYDEDKAKNRKWDDQADWKGRVQHGWTSCPYSIGRPDKVLHITKGSWYGHPNIQRDQCAWVDPFDNLTADDKPPPAGSNYKKAMVTLESPLTGIAEYRANHFCSRLRGDLIISTYQNGKTYRMGVEGSSVTSGPDELSAHGGITFVENAHGDLIFPRLSQKNVFVLRPKVSAKSVLFIAGAIPFRHGKAGGTNIFIGGSNFGSLPSVEIGSKTCTILNSSDTEITCKVPAHTGGAKPLSVIAATGESVTLPGAVLYMNV